MTAQPTDAIVIRHSIPADVNSFRELRLEALENHPTSFGADYAENKLKPQTYWEERLAFFSEEQALFFAEEKSQLIGMAGIYRSLSKKSSHCARIWGVYVKPAWRGRHVSEMLMRSCLEWAGQQQAVVVKLAVVTDNLAAIHCYERLGFKVYGTEPKAIIYEGVYYDEYLMSLDIDN
jgi:ribosomal protein S18 acetylase RimI-like enzyme